MGFFSSKCKVLFMSFDRFLLAVESHDLSQADKSIIRVSSFPILRGLRAFVLQKVQASVVERQKKKFCFPSLSFGKEDTLIILLSA